MHELNQGRESTQANYASRLRELTREIKGAISALERNDLKEFQRHLANQEVMAAEIGPNLQAAISAGGELRTRNHSRSSAGKDLYDAGLELAQANRTFAAVLKRLIRSTTILSALYQSSAGAYGKTVGAVEGRRTLSCEV